ncbi:RDD family protein [Clostridium sp.]|uniref:RDD family protein n=1 Tax=Clostridium sp. TaxID=1506 RepID=UPI001A458355|nr:RDD family protein [Clostridium sp.]MBK5241376.1 RDD family protein [Clostridium sp.]
MLEQNEDNSEELNHIENNEVVESQEGIAENIKVDKSIKPRFVDTLKASIIDLIVIGGISTALVFIGDSILRLAGFFVTQKFQMSFIIFMVVMVLYTSIMESGKTSTTLGKKISGLIITKA